MTIIVFIQCIISLWCECNGHSNEFITADKWVQIRSKLQAVCVIYPLYWSVLNSHLGMCAYDKCDSLSLQEYSRAQGRQNSNLKALFILESLLSALTHLDVER